jgi:hypothetical protein
MMVVMEQLVEWRLEGETELLGENLLWRHFVRHKSHTTWSVLESGPPRWLAGDWPPEIWRGLYIINCYNNSCEPVTVAARSKAWTVSARLDAGIVGSNPIKDINIWCVCVRLCCVCVVLCLGSGLETGRSLVQGVYHLWKMITELKKRPGLWVGSENHCKKKVNT